MPRFRALDGLRGVAVLAVVVFHAVPHRFPIGWVGVDVFFVLSGYLITALLLAELDADGRVDLARFYLRRAARLAPGLILAVGLAAAVRAPLSLRDAVTALAYLGDVSRMTGHDIGALGHTWSLAIEEHFYLAWPLVVIAVKTRRRVAVCAAAGATTSFAAMCWLSPPTAALSVAAYNGPHARSWGLLLGCVLACVPLHHVAGRIAGIAATASAGLVVFAAATRALQVVSGVLALAGASAAVAVICVAVRGWWTPLRWWPLPQVGTMSYGVYLYHYPILMAPALGAPRAVDVAVRVAATLTLAAVSHRWVEAPILAAARRFRNRAPASASEQRTATLRPS